jgi:hypothetical protein
MKPPYSGGESIRPWKARVCSITSRACGPVLPNVAPQAAVNASSSASAAASAAVIGIRVTSGNDIPLN